MNQQPLAGIRVVDLTHVLAGPYCTYLLGLLGAEIIKVEIPGGEMGRWMAPPGPLHDAGLGAAFLAQAAGKRMLAVDIRKPEGAEILRRLLRNADVFVEGLRPGAVARAGFDEASLRALTRGWSSHQCRASDEMGRSPLGRPTITSCRRCPD